MGVNSQDRFSKSSPCPICQGHPGLPKGKGVRCVGYWMEGHQAVICTRHGSDTAIETETGTGWVHPVGEGSTRPHGSTSSGKAGWRSTQDFGAWLKEKESWDAGGLWYYHDKNGKEVMAVLRFNTQEGGKQFIPMYKLAAGMPRDGLKPGVEAGQWICGDPPGSHDKSALPLYNLPAILAAPKNCPVFVVEGEKAADSIIGLGSSKDAVVATTSAHGAKSPQRTDWSPLKGRQVVLVPDNDSAGEKYVAAVARLIKGTK